MSRAERDKWDARYRAGAYAERAHPTALLAEWLDRCPRGRALDVACGAGRNALFLAAAGYAVDAVDISPAGLERGSATAAERGVEVSWHCVDLEERPDALPRGPYDLAVWVRYVNAALWPAVVSRLAPGGHVLVEQHLVTRRRGRRTYQRRVPARARGARARGCGTRDALWARRADRRS